MIHPHIETETVHPVGDVRAQLWARMYATVLSSIDDTAVLAEVDPTSNNARRVAIYVANYAVTDFDEHYLGSKR